MNPINRKNSVWITGASSGIGYKLALTYAQRGYCVIASARNAQRLETLAREAERFEGNIIGLPADVTSEESVRDAMKRVVELAGVPDITILNAGYYQPCELDELTLDHFQKTIDVNYMGVVRCFLAVLPHYRKNQSGHIVIVSSVAGYSGLPRAAAYGSSKAALTHLAESIRHECIREGIDVTVVNPGFVKTPLTDLNSFSMPFMVEADVAAERMFAGIEKKKFEVTFPRRFTWILKFLRILPYSLYFAVTKKLL